MTCDEAKEQLVLLAYDELPGEQQAELDLHTIGCTACQEDMAALASFSQVMEAEELPAVSPNLLASARMRLDDALDEAGTGTWLQRLRVGASSVWRHLYAAPALATFLVGAGFLSGNFVTRYQAVSTPPTTQMQPVGPIQSQGSIGQVSGITQTGDPDVVEVSYNRIVPTTFRGRIEEPETRALLMAAQKSADNTVRVDGVGYLARACDAGHMCEHGSRAEDLSVRDALLVRLSYDKSPAVRLKALQGLRRFVPEDQKVRDAVLQALMSDRSAEVRSEAIDMLTPVQGDSSVRQVLHTVSTQDANPYIRNASLQALGNVDGLQ